MQVICCADYLDCSSLVVFAFLLRVPTSRKAVRKKPKTLIFRSHLLQRHRNIREVPARLKVRCGNTKRIAVLASILTNTSYVSLSSSFGYGTREVHGLGTRLKRENASSRIVGYFSCCRLGLPPLAQNSTLHGLCVSGESSSWQQEGKPSWHVEACCSPHHHYHDNRTTTGRSHCAVVVVVIIIGTSILQVGTASCL